MTVLGARVVEPLVGRPDFSIRPPGSKSHTNRALVLASIARGPSTLRGALVADDTEVMIEALGRLGVTIRREGTTIQVQPGDGSPVTGEVRIDAGLSGTTSRFLLALAPVLAPNVVLDGRGPLRRRPMGPLLDALAELGVVVDELGDSGCLPVRLTATGTASNLVRVDASESSQFLSALLLSAPAHSTEVTIDAGNRVVARPFVDLTLESLADFGATVTEEVPGRFVVCPGGLTGRDYDIEVDATAASYFAAAAAISGGRVRLDGLGSSIRQGDMRFLDLLEQMGAHVTRSSDATTVVGGVLHGIDVDLADAPDIVQTLAVTAVFADSPTTIRGVGFIRGHETDRLAALTTELGRVGVEVRQGADGLEIAPGSPKPGTVQTYDDHRMAMSFALLGLRARGISVEHPDVVAKTYPGFWDDFDALCRSCERSSEYRIQDT